MKRRSLLFVLTLGLAIPVSAQLTVLKSGQIQAGKITYKSTGGTILASQADRQASPGLTVPTIEVDSTAQLVMLGKGTNNFGGKISFGDGSKVFIGECNYHDRLTIQALLGTEFRLNGVQCFSLSKKTNANPTASFQCAVTADAFNVRSDLRLKKSVKSLGDTWTLLNDVNPIEYRLSERPAASAVNVGVEKNLAVAQPDQRLQYGFAAQEIKEIFPNLVSEDEDGWLSIDYTGFIPLLVDAVKDLGRQNSELKDEIERMKADKTSPKKAPAAAGNDGIAAESPLSLSQNRPNPFSDRTEITCSVPESVAEASLHVYDLQGSEVLNLNVDGRGLTRVTIEATSLKPGMYLYTLIADGEEVDTKRMILTD